MTSRLTVAISRAKYAAIGAAIGAALGALVSRNAASTGGGIGALAGATFGEARLATSDRYAELKRKVRPDAADAEDGAEIEITD